MNARVIQRVADALRRRFNERERERAPWTPEPEPWAQLHEEERVFWMGMALTALRAYDEARGQV